MLIYRFFVSVLKYNFSVHVCDTETQSINKHSKALVPITNGVLMSRSNIIINFRLPYLIKWFNFTRHYEGKFACKKGIIASS